MKITLPRIPGPAALSSLLLAGLLVSSAPLAGQTLLGSAGLGFPHDGLDARARGMGSLGIGMAGSAIIPADPTSAAGSPVPVLTATYQPSWSTFDFQGAEQDLTASRFPLVGVAYPVSSAGGTATLTFSSYLDQNWLAEEESTLTLSGGETVDVRDQFRSEGGVSALRLGWIQAVGGDVHLALAAGTYLGEARRSLTRFFSGEELSLGVSPYQIGTRWRFTGPTVTAGASWDPSELVHLAGSVIWSGDLHAEPITEGARERDIPLPTEFRLGATGFLSPALSANVGMAYADWSETGESLTDSGTVGGAWTWGGGLEWDGFTLFGRTAPVRIGARHQDLPFLFDGAAPTETTVSAGLGVVLLRTTSGVPLASVDAAYEQGSREAGSFSETFGRATVTIRVAGQ